MLAPGVFYCWQSANNNTLVFCCLVLVFWFLMVTNCQHYALINIWLSRYSWQRITTHTQYKTLEASECFSQTSLYESWPANMVHSVSQEPHLKAQLGASEHRRSQDQLNHLWTESSQRHSCCCTSSCVIKRDRRLNEDQMSLKEKFRPCTLPHSWISTSWEKLFEQLSDNRQRDPVMMQ